MPQTFQGDIAVLGEARINRVITGAVNGPSVMIPSTPNHLRYASLAIPPKLPVCGGAIENGNYFYIWSDVAGTVRYQDNTVAYTFTTAGLILATLIDNTSANGFWNIVNITSASLSLFTFKNSVLSTQSVPPGGPACGDRYLVGSGAVGAWLGKDKYIAQWDCVFNVWTFEGPPVAGWATVDSSGPTFLIFDGVNWVPLAVVAGLTSAMNGLHVTGGNIVEMGGLLNQGTVVDGISAFSYAFQNIANFSVHSTISSIMQAGNVVTGPKMLADAVTNRLSFRTGGGTGALNQVPVADGVGGWLWQNVPAVVGVTAADNGLFTVGSTVKLGAPLNQHTTVTTTGFRFDLGNPAIFPLMPNIGNGLRIGTDTDSLWLGSNIPIMMRTNGSNGAVNNILRHNGSGLVYDTLANLIALTNPYVGVNPIQVIGNQISILPSVTNDDVLTTVGGVVVWQNFTSNPTFTTTVNSLINTYINNPLFFTTNLTFATSLNTYINSQTNVYNVNSLAAGLNGQVLTTLAGVVQWAFPSAVFSVTSATAMIVVSGSYVLNLFGNPIGAGYVIQSTGVNSYVWTALSSLFSLANIANAVGPVSAALPFGEVLQPSAAPNYTFRRIIPFNYATTIHYTGVPGSEAISIKNAIAPATAPVANSFLYYDLGTNTYTWNTGFTACSQNGLNSTTGCVELGGTLLHRTFITGTVLGNNIQTDAISWYLLNLRQTPVNSLLPGLGSGLFQACGLPQFKVGSLKEAYLGIRSANINPIVPSLPGMFMNGSSINSSDGCAYMFHRCDLNANAPFSAFTNPQTGSASLLLQGGWTGMEGANINGIFGQIRLGGGQTNAKGAYAIIQAIGDYDSQATFPSAPYSPNDFWGGWIVLSGGIVYSTSARLGVNTEISTTIPSNETIVEREVSCSTLLGAPIGEYHRIRNSGLGAITVTGANPIPTSIIIPSGKSVDAYQYCIFATNDLVWRFTPLDF